MTKTNLKVLYQQHILNFMMIIDPASIEVDKRVTLVIITCSHFLISLGSSLHKLFPLEHFHKYK